MAGETTHAGKAGWQIGLNLVPSDFEAAGRTVEARPQTKGLEGPFQKQHDWPMTLRCLVSSVGSLRGVGGIRNRRSVYENFHQQLFPGPSLFHHQQNNIVPLPLSVNRVAVHQQKTTAVVQQLLFPQLFLFARVVHFPACSKNFPLLLFCF